MQNTQVLKMTGARSWSIQATKLDLDLAFLSQPDLEQTKIFVSVMKIFESLSITFLTIFKVWKSFYFTFLLLILG